VEQVLSWTGKINDRHAMVGRNVEGS
jgi:hypothetical protein